METHSSSSRGSDLTARPNSPPHQSSGLGSQSPILYPSSSYTPPTPTSPASEHSFEGSEQDLLDMSSNTPAATLMDEEEDQVTPSVNLPAPSLPPTPAGTSRLSSRTARPLPRTPHETSTPVSLDNLYAPLASQSTVPANDDLLTPPRSPHLPSLATTAVGSVASSVDASEERDGGARYVLDESDDNTGSMLEEDAGDPSPPSGYSYRNTPSPNHLPPLPPSPVHSAPPPDHGPGEPALHELDVRELLTSGPSSPEAILAEESAEEELEEGDLDEALSEMHLLLESYAALREQMAITSGSVEETTERIMDAIRKHKCPDAKESDAHSEELAKAQALIVRYKRHIDTLASRAQHAEARTREAETASARHLVDLERLKKEVVQGHEDIKTSERHGEMVNRKLAEAVNSLAAAQVENEELRANHSVLKHTQASKPSFVLILLEGEGRLFDPKLLALGADGGMRFVDTLKAEAARLFNMMNLGTCGKIHIHLYMDLAITFRDLRKAGFISSDKQFEDFLESMGERDPLCTVSDVAGMFGASYKIRAQMASFGMLDSCGMVFIGAATDRKYLAEVAGWKRSGARVVDKLFAARSTPDRRDDPFLPLGDDRLFAVESLFPTSPAEWARLMAAPRPERNAFGNRAPLLMDPTGASTAQALPPAIQPNPALVPNYVVHAQTPRYDPASVAADTYRGQLGSPIPFTPMPTGVRYPNRGRRDPSPPPPPTTRAPRSQRAAPPVPKYAPPPTPAPPWQEYRASRNRDQMPEMLRRSVASGTATPPRRFNDGVAFRKSARSPSIGGSPPSTDEDNPLDPTIPAAARTHVERPPRFGGPDRSAAGSTTGAPPPGFRVRDGWGR